MIMVGNDDEIEPEILVDIGRFLNGEPAIGKSRMDMELPLQIHGFPCNRHSFPDMRFHRKRLDPIQQK